MDWNCWTWVTASFPILCTLVLFRGTERNCNLISPRGGKRKGAEIEFPGLLSELLCAAHAKWLSETSSANIFRHSSQKPHVLALWAEVKMISISECGNVMREFVGMEKLPSQQFPRDDDDRRRRRRRKVWHDNKRTREKSKREEVNKPSDFAMNVLRCGWKSFFPLSASFFLVWGNNNESLVKQFTILRLSWQVSAFGAFCAHVLKRVSREKLADGLDQDQDWLRKVVKTTLAFEFIFISKQLD